MLMRINCAKRPLERLAAPRMGAVRAGASLAPSEALAARLRQSAGGGDADPLPRSSLAPLVAVAFPTVRGLTPALAR